MRYLRGLLEHIHIYQPSWVLGDGSVVSPSEYLCIPWGRLGIAKVCSPGFEPYKICEMLNKHFKSPGRCGSPATPTWTGAGIRGTRGRRRRSGRRAAREVRQGDAGAADGGVGEAGAGLY